MGHPGIYADPSILITSLCWTFGPLLLLAGLMVLALVAESVFVWGQPTKPAPPEPWEADDLHVSEFWE